MPLPVAVLAMVLLLVGLGGYVALVIRIFRRVRGTLAGRGYKSPLAHALVGTSAFLSVFLVTLALRGMLSEIDPLWLGGAALLLVPAAFLGAAHLLPARDPRTEGPRVVTRTSSWRSPVADASSSRTGCVP